MIELSHTAEKTVKRYLHKTARKEKNMSTKMYVNGSDRKGHINPEIYGHFSEHLGRCIYNGIYVGEDSSIPNTKGIRNDIVEAFKNIKMPVLRWPGGCFADEYHWKDGIGEKSQRKKMINTHWGGVTEDNSFGTHEFFNFCEMVGCEPYLSGNLGSGTVQEMSEWIEYITSDNDSPMTQLRKKNGREKPWKLKYLGVGNENWGCGGNMSPEQYSALYKQYQTYCRNYGANQLYKVACGPNGDDYNWTKVITENITPNHTNAVSLHYYTVPKGKWEDKGNATGFTDEEYYITLEKTWYMETLVKRHCDILNVNNPENNIKLVVDEWGTWYNVEEGTNPGFLFQQNTMRDAMVASINLNIFNSHCDRISMANLAQAVNVLQALILTEGERMILTPTYHVFDLYKNHQNAELCYSSIEDEKQEGYNLPVISQSVSVNSDNEMTLTVSNCSLTECRTIEADIRGFSFDSVRARILSAESNAHNTFDEPENVTITEFDKVTKIDSGITFTLPPCSVAEIILS